MMPAAPMMPVAAIMPVAAAMVLVARMVAVAVMVARRGGPVVGEIGLVSVAGVVGKLSAGGYPSRAEQIRP